MAQEVEEEALGSQSSRESRRRTPSGFPTPPTVTTRSRSRAAKLDSSLSSLSPSQRGKRKRSSPSKGKKTTRVTGREGDENPEEDEAAALASPPMMKRARATGRDDEENAEQGAAASAPSSAVSSPLRWPTLPVSGEDLFGEKIYNPFHNIDLAIVRARDKLETQCQSKLDRQLKLASLDDRVRISCLADPKLVKVRESATKMVLRVAKAVVGLTSYLDEKQLRQSSGFVIDWNPETKVGTILTSALLIQSKSSVDEWLAMDEYTPDAEVFVQLAVEADKPARTRLVHYDKHYNLATFEATMDLSAEIPSFSDDLKYAQDVFVLGRDEDWNLSIDYGSVVYEGPNCYLRNHYMFMHCGINELGIGGPVINTDGKFVGMASQPDMAFIPSSIIMKWLRMQRKFGRIPRLHLGMKFSAISLLDPARIERISRKCDVEDGLIVILVSEGSAAEKLGIRPGDIVTSWNGKNISTTVELENFLLHICEEHLEKGKGDSSVDLSVSIFHIRKKSHSIMNLKVNMSSDVEVVAQGTYIVTAADCNLPCDDDAGPSRGGHL